MALLLLLCVFLRIAALIAAMEPARAHEARQGPISSVTTILSTGPGPASVHTSSTSGTTMSPTSASASSRTASATPQPSSSPSLNITVQNMTTCTSGLISWNFSGETTELFLSVTNIGVDQGDYALRRIRARQYFDNATVQQQLADTNTSASSWTWPTVNLTQGWYKIQGLALAAPYVSNDSDPFFITNGTNVACLTSSLSQTSSTPSPSSPSVSASALSAASKSHVASVVGGVIGGVVGLLLAIVAGVCLWSRKRKTHFAGEGLNRNRKWGSIKSTNSSIQPVADADANGHFHSHSDSTTSALADVVVGKASPSTTPNRSDEDVATMGEEKIVSPASHRVSPFDALSTPVHYDRRASTHYVPSPTTPFGEDTRTRTASIHANQTLEQQAQRIRSSMETSTRRRSERLSMPTLPSAGLARLSHSPTTYSHASPKEEYALSCMTTVPVNRSISSGGISTTARRTPRKPVPHYNPSSLQEDTNADTVSMFTAGAESTHSHATCVGTGATTADLAHPAGYVDGRPVHYLIPDMPPPLRD